MRLQSLHIKNYGCLADFELREIPPLAIFVGANGTGKSTLFDAFQFLRDCLRDDVGVALGLRGGFDAVRTRATDGPIEFELVVHEGGEEPADLTYCLGIGQLEGADVVTRETLRLRANLDAEPIDLTVRRELHRGATEPEGSTEDLVIAEEFLSDSRLWLDQPIMLLVAAEQNRRVGGPRSDADDADAHFAVRKRRHSPSGLLSLTESLRERLREVYVSNIDPAAAKIASEVARDHRLAERGGNLANALRHQARDQQAESLRQALSVARRAIPGLERVEPVETFDGRVALRFIEAPNGDTFNAQHVSDGTVKLVAYSLLLNESERHPLLCIEEPENYLYPTLMWDLIDEIRGYAYRGDAQVFVATHSPALVDAADPDEVFWLSKVGGKTDVHRVNDDPQLVAQHGYGDHLGRMWQSGAFGGAHPE